MCWLDGIGLGTCLYRAPYVLTELILKQKHDKLPGKELGWRKASISEFCHLGLNEILWTEKNMWWFWNYDSFLEIFEKSVLWNVEVKDFF